ncbi:unnamed protein product [Allacma fusca]|uniref:Chaoptin n=1 Tax=Allacma fusca TaxID=39272 RepID=A0A8J2JIQ0_9HEXA|nr:unnamed protein product [Allacma fusca]
MGLHPVFYLLLVLTAETLRPVLPLSAPAVEIFSEDEWLSCRDFPDVSTLPNCLCQLSEDEAHIKVNCDNVVFSQDFPNLPFRKPIIYFSQKHAKYQNIPPQALLASGVPLKTLDLSHNLLRRLTEKSLEGLSETLEHLDLSDNLLGDQLNPIFSTSEFKRLPRLRSLRLSNNLLFDIDGGILEGTLSLHEFHVDKNQLRKVPKQGIKGPNSLRLLNLAQNSIDMLATDDFSMQQSLLLLNVSHNVLSTIQSGAFQGMSNLKMVDLSYNRLHRLNSDAFNGLTSIDGIDLSYNYLSQIPITALTAIRTLRGLRLAGNLIQSLEGTSLLSMRSLEVLDLSRNRLNEIPRDFFNGMNKLRDINLGVNQLRTISASVFEGLPNLKALNLMDNNLLTFPSAALEPLASLTMLTLDYNRISALVPMKIHNITKLSLSNNLIRDIPSDTFANFPNLVTLNLYGNLIESLDEVTLPLNIRELNLGLNSLKTLPRFQLPNLQKLKLSRNELKGLLPHNFVLTPNLLELDLSSNYISSFFENTFDGLGQLEDLDMSGNKLQALPIFGNLSLLRTLNFSKNRLREIGKMENMETLQNLDLSSNLITNLRPEMFGNTSNLERINLRNNQLTSFKGFTGFFMRLKEINLSKNQISYVYPNSFEEFEQLWKLDLSRNRFTFFPTEFLKNCPDLRQIDLSHNQIKSLNEMNFANFPHLRHLDFSNNLIELILHNSFLNSSQLQYLDISGNKLESIDGNTFHGVIRLELDLSNNYLATLPPMIFDRIHVQKLHRINLSRNSFQTIPSDALQKQYFYLEALDMSDNQVTEIPNNLNVLVNVKELDLSNNPIDENSLKHILSEPKTVRTLSLSRTKLKQLPILEMPFLRFLNLSENLITGFDENVFQRTTLLNTLLLNNNKLVSLESSFPASLQVLDLSSNPLTSVNSNVLPINLQSLKLNHLESILKIDKSAINLKGLITLEMYDLPKLGYLDIRGLLTNLPYLENFDFEVKDNQIVDQIHPGINSRVKSIGLRGRRIRSISTGAFAGLTSPTVRISLVNTSLTLLPSILVPVPMSSNIILDLSGSKISNLSPPFLSQNIKLAGLSPMCDCNAVHLVRYLKNVESDVHCSGPKKMLGHSVLDIGMDELVCESGLSTPPPILHPTDITTTPTTSTTADDIIWSLPTKSSKTKTAASKKQDKAEATATKSKSQDISIMDNLIIGIVGGVVGLILLFVIIIVCFVKMSNKSDNNDGYPGAAPSVISVAPGYAPSSKCTCPQSHAKGGGQLYIPTNYSTVKSNGKMVQPYPSLPTFTGIYGMHPNYINSGAASQYGYNGTIRHHQQPAYGSLPYMVHDEYDRRS